MCMTMGDTSKTQALDLICINFSTDDKHSVSLTGLDKNLVKDQKRPKPT